MLGYNAFFLINKPKAIYLLKIQNDQLLLHFQFKGFIKVFHILTQLHQIGSKM